MVGIDKPHESFLWWIEARRNESPPDVGLIERRVHEIFNLAWPERAQRMIVGAGQIEIRSGLEWVRHPSGVGGPIIYGPYMPLLKGCYQCSFHLHNPGQHAIFIVCDVMVGSQELPLESRGIAVEPGLMIVTLDFVLNSLEFGVQFRCISYEQGSILCRKTVDLKHLTANVFTLDVMVSPS